MTLGLDSLRYFLQIERERKVFHHPRQGPVLLGDILHFVVKATFVLLLAGWEVDLNLEIFLKKMYKLLYKDNFKEIIASILWMNYIGSDCKCWGPFLVLASKVFRDQSFT
jgi:hypothetical protein